MKITYRFGTSIITIGGRLELESVDNVQVVISVTDVPPDRDLYSKYEVYWYPWIENGQLTPFESIAACLYTIDSTIRRGVNIFIHCDAGTHRSPSMFGFYLKSYLPNDRLGIVENRLEKDCIFSDPNRYADSYCKQYPALVPLLNWLPTGKRLDQSNLWPSILYFGSTPLLQYLKFLDWKKTFSNLKCVITPKVVYKNSRINFGHDWVDVEVGTAWIQTRCGHCNKIKSLRPRDA